MRAGSATGARPGTPSRPPESTLRRVVVGSAVLLAVFHLAAVPVNAANPDPSTAVALVDDDGGLAMFDERDMAPGEASTACIAIAAEGSADAGREVALTADLTRADLAPYLHLTIEAGRTGSFGNCASFTGRTIWSGPLADMPTVAETGIATGWRPARQNRAVFRFTAVVAGSAAAQKRTAEASFNWTLVSELAAAPPVAPRRPKPVTRKEQPPAPPAGPAVVVPNGRPDVLTAPPLRAGPNLAEKILNAAVAVAKTVVGVLKQGHFPLILLAIIAGFLAVQGKLDRRDPKLALARVRGEFADFEDFRPRIGSTS